MRCAAIVTLSGALSGVYLLVPAALAAPTEPETLLVPLDPAGTCLDCHAFPNPVDREDEPAFAPVLWQGSMMANAARDPVFWAAVAIADQDAPGQTIDCIRCHAPKAFLEGRGDATQMDALLPDDLDGVSCDLCHRLVDDGATPAGNARYTVDDLVGVKGVPRRGPWTYGPRDLAPSHDWAGPDPHIASSRSCGTCHDVTTEAERVDEDGNGLGVGFGEQRTYSEWLGSAFAAPGEDFRSCQDCHMPAVADVAGCEANNLVGATHPTGGRRHDLVGANRFVTTILRGQYGSSGTGQFLNQPFDRSIERIEALAQQAASLELTAPASVDVGEGIPELTVRVTNNSGHKLPTGYSEGRVLWIEIEGTYEGSTLWSSGRWTAATGRQDDAQQHSYEAIAEHAASGDVFHLLRSNRWLVDNRIPPLGLVPDPETDPVGDRYALGADGTWPNFDTVSYAFEPVEATDANGETADTLIVTARLRYLVNTPDYVAFLADENVTNDAGGVLAELFDEYAPNEPLVLAEASLSIPLSGLDPAGASTGDGDTSDAGVADTTTAGDPVPLTSSTGGEGSSDAGDSSGAAAVGDEDGCACGVGGGPMRWPWLLLWAAAVPRRRRATCRRSYRAPTPRADSPSRRPRCTPGAPPSTAR